MTIDRRDERFAAWRRWASDHQRRWQVAVVALALVVVATQWVRAAAKLDDGDFHLHWQFANRFVHHQLLYADGLHIPYPPFWAMAWSPIAALSLRAAKIACYPLSVAALGGLLFLLDRLTRRQLPLARGPRFWATVAALALASRFLVRELPECGPNLALVALTWLAIDLWTRGRDAAGGVCLGLATALKCTPGLFIVYFAWKRQWKFAIVAMVTAGGCTLAPALWQGPREYALHATIWLTNLRAAAAQPDPSLGILGQEELKNLALKPAVARYLMRLPPGHLSRVEHPWYVEFLDLSPAAAGWGVKLALLALLAAAAWSARGPMPRRDDLALVWQCAAISALILSLSPITWYQHAVALVPAFYLLARTAAARGALPRATIVVLAAFVVVNLVLARGLIGRDLSQLLASYHPNTLIFLALLAATLVAARRETAVAERTPAGPPISADRRREAA
ncbi:MAG TPA: glycosyltransferase family 87 protein [Pirellulales bacterium]|nr:glycosyltransferase family 87 protein [Pirellulales bacterium]